MGGLVAACVRRRWLVVLGALVLAVGSLWLISARLSVDTDTGDLFASSLPWKRYGAELQRDFPQNEDLIVAVIDASVPEEAEVTAHGLASALRRDTAHFSEVTEPEGSPYFARNAFLFLDRDALAGLLDRTIDAQPFLGKLAADPSLRGLCGALDLIARGVEAGHEDLGSFSAALDAFHRGLADSLAGKPKPLSWERLLAGAVADQAGRFVFVLAKPKLDYGALQPGAAASAAIRAAAARLAFVRDGSARVRLTGSVALNDEEFGTVAEGAAYGLGGSTLLVALWLFLAVRSWRVMVPILLTLLCGLLLTTGFAALAVGTLNLVSIAFAILFIGIAVDFAIQFGVRMRDAQHDGAGVAEALVLTGRRAGAQILVAALATSAGFLAFTPTDFNGVAQLGLIAGVGMLIAFLCTMTLLPALLALMKPASGHAEAGLSVGVMLDPMVMRWRRPILAVFCAVAALGAMLLPLLPFDGDPLHTKNVTTEAMRTLADLIDDPVTNPYTMEMLVPDAGAAAAVIPALKKLPTVDDVLWLRSFVPDRQADKLGLIADAAGLLGPTLSQPAVAAAVDPGALRAAVREAATRLEGVAGRLPAGSPLTAIAGDLRGLGDAPDRVLIEADRAMVRFLPMQLDRLRVALQAASVTEADVPPDIRASWIAPDGRPRLQVTPKASVRGSAALHRFVAEVQAVAPHSAGSAVTIVRSADTVVTAFRVAAFNAAIAITVILLVVLRRWLNAAIVLASLLVSSLMTVAIVVTFHIALNFANIIALPLLLGVGISFNVYFVMNWQAGLDHPLGSATARAVLFSALTTATAFGSLALSRHPGTASMGALLLISLGCTVLSAMFFLPAVLAALAGRAGAVKGKAGWDVPSPPDPPSFM
jgi:hopanoid biosynthesis associated RND transporter like protein HpnN